MANSSVWPPNTSCWLNNTDDWMDSLSDATDACSRRGLANVTQGMVDFLNLTSFDNYLQAYCVNPTPDDSCPFNVCPNSDVAGILTRISIYLSTFLLVILLYYSKSIEKIRDSYWAQNFTVYSVLVAAAISMAQQNMTKMHTIVAMEFVGSPLTVYLAFYAVRSFFGNKHRLSHLFDGPRFWYRVTALFTFAVWAIFLGISLGLSHEHYAQSSCQHRMKMINTIYLLPFFLALGLMMEAPEAILIIVGPPAIVAISWGIAIFRRRKMLWYKNGVRRRPSFFDVWTMVGHEFPFIHFMSVCVFPCLIWLGTIEITLLGSNDNNFQSSFGQVLAIFVALPPLVSVLEMTPRFGRWFWDLSWVRLVTFRAQRVKAQQENIHRLDLNLDDTPPGLERTGTAGSDMTKWGDDTYSEHDDYSKPISLSSGYRYATVSGKDV